MTVGRYAEPIGQLCAQFKLPTVGSEAVPLLTRAGHGEALESLLEEKGVKKRRHLGKEAWEAVIEAVEELGTPLKPLLKELGVSRSSYYRRRREYEEGGIRPRRRGLGRRRRYTVEAWGKRIVEVMRSLPPTAGHRRVWVKLRGEGLSRSTVWRLMKEMGLLLPAEKGKARRRYEVLKAEVPDQVWTSDTTFWPLEGTGVWIYLAMDVKSRWACRIQSYLSRGGASTVDFFLEAFRRGKPGGAGNGQGPRIQGWGLPAFPEPGGGEVARIASEHTTGQGAD